MDGKPRSANNPSARGADRPRCATDVCLLSRRRMLALGAGALAAAVAAGRLDLTRAFQGSGAGDLVEPAVRASRDGLLETTLEARPSPLDLLGRTVTTPVYEGMLPGPTLRVRPGDRLTVRLVNRLTEPTNLHVHGLHVSPQGNADNPFLRVAPCESQDYEFALPADHPAGLYWYHPHWHQAVADQVFGGLAGAIVVEGDLDRLPGIVGLPERLLLLGVMRLDRQGRVAPGDEFQNQPFVRLVNGQRNPTLRIRAGETQRWRLGNISPDTFFRVQLTGHALHQIAADGNTLNEVWTRDEIVLAPGQRAEALVQGGPPGTYELRQSSRFPSSSCP